MGSTSGPSIPIQLNILIVGAGIAGLTAASALKQAGHKVTIFESSRLHHEVGAAITLSPNGTRVLQKLNFDFKAARGVPMEKVSIYSAKTLESQSTFAAGSMGGIEKVVGFPFRAFHRVDLHNVLKKLALDEDGTGEGAELLVGVKIVRVDVQNVEVELDDGRVFHGDLLVGADGIHSFVRTAALESVGREDEKVQDLGWEIYRFLLPTEQIMEDTEARKLCNASGRSSFVLPYKETSLRMVWYSCRDGEVQNFAAFVPSKVGGEDGEDYDHSADKEAILEIFKDFHPTLLNLIRKADVIKSWRLRNRTPLPTYIYGKSILIGDAAHPMLPFNAQGGNQALEDGGALLGLLSNLPSKDVLPERLEMFDAVRRKRASRQQILSSVPADQLKSLEDTLKAYEGEGARAVEGESVKDRTMRDFSYDVFESCRKVLIGTS